MCALAFLAATPIIQLFSTPMGQAPTWTTKHLASRTPAGGGHSYSPGPNLRAVSEVIAQLFIG